LKAGATYRASGLVQRVIYRIEKRQVQVLVVEITAHDHRRK
jgi:hypothetical protein